ncbi:DUF742 domain-containing protein [Lentzea sp. NPDC042327]|uniref:DUF742 domain-containing protein n=1 Tax=Lentzea sp. NPDC042327 TaxID=3154801 RepID=UPI0033EC5301
MSGDDDQQVSFGDLMSGFSLDSDRIRRRGRKHRAKREPAPEPVEEPDRPAPPVFPRPDLYAQPDPYATTVFEPVPPLPPIESASIVRAYAWTGGRTTSEVHLEIETLVSVNERSVTAVRPEHQEVLALCSQPRSVAEIAALRGLPLGVTKVLLGDMAGHGLIDVHRTASSYGDDRPDGALMERVLAGLRRL